MSRTLKIDFQRITFSFPAKVVQALKAQIENRKMSSYVAELIEKDLESKKISKSDDFFEKLDFLTADLAAKKMNKSRSLEILREIRYGKN